MKNHEIEKGPPDIQVYFQRKDFLEQAGRTIARALDRSEGVIVICTKERWNLLMTSLPAMASALAQCQILFSDVHESLLRIRDEEGVPEFSRFVELLGEMLAGFGARRPPVRFYAELSNILCAAGAEDQAAVLDGFWNAFLSVNRDCALFCGFDAQNLAGQRGGLRHRRNEAAGPSARV